MSTVNLDPLQTIDHLETPKAFRKLYYARAVFSIIWVLLVFTFAEKNTFITNMLFIIYPAWDAFATFLDIKIDNRESKVPQYVNLAISATTTIGVLLALLKGLPTALIVIGIWAIVTGLIQLVLAIRRRKLLGGQWPMIISGGQSMIGGSSFIILADSPTIGMHSLAGYAAFGALYFLLSAIRLTLGNKKNKH
ncbi:MAG: hypothetical protein V7724_15695 [Sediminicola sp.]